MNLRFAPTLNDKIHLGNIRILLFNYLFSCITSQSLILRIDYKKDIKIENSNDNILHILQVCKHFNIKVHKQIYQENRIDIYKAFIQKIDDKFKITVNDVVYLNTKSIFADKKYIQYNDFVYGTLKKQTRLINNFPVYSISNDSFFYNFTSTVDDIDMSINLIIRGGDHIDNTFTQLSIYHALNKTDIPKYAHIPLCLDLDGKKLSKSSSKDNLDLEQLLYNEFIVPDTIFYYLTGICFNDLEHCTLSNVKITRKNKIINLQNLMQCNSAILKKLNANALHNYISSYLKIKIKIENLQIIQPFIINTKQFIKDVTILELFETKNIVYLKKNLQSSAIDKITYSTLNKLFNISIGKELIEIFGNQYILDVLMIVLN